MDGSELGCIDGTALVDGLTDHVDDSSEGLGADWHQDGSASVDDALPSDQALSGVQGNSSHVVTTQVLSDLKDQSVLGSLDFESVENGREVPVEVDVDDGTNNL